MGVYLRAKFEVSRIIPTGFRRGNFTHAPPPPPPQNESLKSPPRLGLKKYAFYRTKWNESPAKNATYESLGSCDSFSVSLNSYLKNNLSAYCFSKWYCTLCRRSNICSTKENDACFYWLFWWSFKFFHWYLNHPQSQKLNRKN